MAKQKNNGKGETPKPKQVKGRKTLNPIRVRSEEGQTVAIRQKASNDFSNWLQSSRNVELV